VSDAENLVRDFLDLLAVPDTRAAIDLLHPDVEWRNTGLPTFRGARVHDMFRDMVKRGFGFRVELHHIAADGDVVLTDRTDVLTYGRWSASFWVRGTFELREGRIVLWDDAFSWGDFISASVLGLARAIGPR